MLMEDRALWGLHLSSIDDFLLPFLIALPIAILVVLVIRNYEPGDGGQSSDPGSPGPFLKQAADQTPAAVGSAAKAASAVTADPLATRIADSAAREPLSSRTAPASIASAPYSPAQSRVLVVDDSAVVRAKLSRLLAANGYEVVLAVDGVDAMSKLAATTVALIITDLEMPNMSGMDLIASVHGSLETEGVPIIAITGHDDLQAKVHDFGGVFGIFKKPWSDRELLRHVEKLIAMSAVGGQP